MQRKPQPYSDTLGLRLIDALVLAHGALFRAADAIEAAERLQISTSHTYKLLHQLTRSGFLRRLPTGLYVVSTPSAGGAEPHSFAIATQLVRPSAISHWSALHHWGLVEQVPFVVTTSTPKSVVTPEMRGQSPEGPAQRDTHAAWQIDGVRYEYVRIPARDMFGIEEVWVDARSRVPIFDRERALLDAFFHFRGFGAGGLGAQVLAAHPGEVDHDKLVRYAERMERPRLLARVKSALAKVSTP